MQNWVNLKNTSKFNDVKLHIAIQALLTFHKWNIKQTLNGWQLQDMSHYKKPPRTIELNAVSQLPVVHRRGKKTVPHHLTTLQ